MTLRSRTCEFFQCCINIAYNCHIQMSKLHTCTLRFLLERGGSTGQGYRCPHWALCLVDLLVWKLTHGQVFKVKRTSARIWPQQAPSVVSLSKILYPHCLDLPKMPRRENGSICWKKWKKKIFVSAYNWHLPHDTTWQDIIMKFHIFIYKGDNFYDFLFAFLHTNSLLRKVFSSL